LALAWKSHLARRQRNAPTVISTFAGAGGSSLGYSMAGFRELLAVEWNPKAADTFHKLFPRVPLHVGDISKLTVKKVLMLSGLEPGELDVLDGSPPCQGFSMAGKRNLIDARNGLFLEYVRLVKGLKPKAFVMENVSGLVKGKMCLIFAEMLRELKACGYDVSARLMNAMYFDVPQSRERTIIIGVRKDLKRRASHPRPQSQPRCVRDAIAGCRVEPVGALSKTYAHYWDRIVPGGSLADVKERLNGKRSHFSDLVKLHPFKPARTMMSTATTHGFATFVHWSEPRPITLAEAKRLASFPDEAEFPDKYGVAWAQMGNSVPPLFMRAIALHLRTHVLAANAKYPSNGQRAHEG